MPRARVRKTGCIRKCAREQEFEKHPDCVRHWRTCTAGTGEILAYLYRSSGDAPAGQELSRFVTLILKNRREAFLQYICLSYLDLYRKSRHIGVAKLTTAVPVSREIWERIRNSASHLLHAKMELQTDVDPSIEGGFIFDINDFRLDASIATQLKRVKQQFIDKNRRIV